MAGAGGQGGRRRRRLLGGAALGLGGCLVAAALVLKHEPARIPRPVMGPDADRAAARLVTKGSALHAALGQAGPWGVAIADAELNAWLATDQPRNHPNLLPRGLSAARVRFRPQAVEAAIRVGSGLLSTVVWCEFEVSLRGVNQVGIVLVAATAGAVPIPRAPVLAELGRRLTALGCVTELRPLDGRMVLVVYIPDRVGDAGPQRRLESLRLDDGEVVVAGSTSVPSTTPPQAAPAH